MWRQCQVWKQFGFKKPEQHSVALMLKKNLLKRLLILKPENLKILMFLNPSTIKLIFHCGEMPMFTVKSCACHRKINMDFALHLRLTSQMSHKYHVSVFSQRINEIEIDNLSQGAISTAYLVIGVINQAIMKIMTQHPWNPNCWMVVSVASHIYSHSLRSPTFQRYLRYSMPRYTWSL